MATIHPTAIVHPGAKLGNDVEVGPYSIIEDDVIIGDNCKIDSHVYIVSGTRLGKNIRVGKGALIGGDPQDLKYRGEKTYLEVGDGTTIREFATLHRGTSYHYKTVIGQNCFIMAYAHVAHDCIIGNHVILSNAVNLAGHVEIGDYAGIGGLTGVHQFVRIGPYSYVGGGFRVIRDVPPYTLALGEPLQYGGINSVGLERHGFSREVIAEIKRAYKIIYRSNLTRKEAVAHIREQLKQLPEIETIIRFVETSQRGIIPSPKNR